MDIQSIFNSGLDVPGFQIDIHKTNLKWISFKRYAMDGGKISKAVINDFDHSH